MSKERILITGTNSLTGWYLFNKAREEHTAYGTYRKKHLSLENPSLYRLDLLDSTVLEALLDRIQPDYIIHAWAICDLDLCEIEPEMASRINVEGTQKILHAVGKFPCVKKFVYFSTDHVFDGEKGFYSEEDEPVPKHVYGETKRQAEDLVRSSGLPFLIIRPGLVIGASFQGNKGPRDFLFSRIRAGKPTHLFTDEWRTPVKAEVLADTVLNLMFSGQEGIYHIAGRERFNRYELGCLLAQKEQLPTDGIFPRLRCEDTWARIRPRDLSLTSTKLDSVLSGVL